MEHVVLTRREALRTRRRRRGGAISIPAHVSPHVQLVFEEMRRQEITYDRAEELSGVLRTTIKAWRHKNKPSLETLEAVLFVLGWTFVAIPTARVLDPALVAALKPVVDQFEISMPDTLAALVALVSRMHERAGIEEAPTTAPPLAPSLADIAEASARSIGGTDLPSTA